MVVKWKSADHFGEVEKDGCALNKIEGIDPPCRIISFSFATTRGS